MRWPPGDQRGSPTTWERATIAAVMRGAIVGAVTWSTLALVCVPRAVPIARDPPES